MIHEYCFFNSYREERSFQMTQNVVLGSELCPLGAVDSYQKKLVKAAICQEKNLRFVTPITPQAYVNMLVKMIYDLPVATKVTFNDFGLLFACKSIIKSKKIFPVLGRIITRSLIDCPWFDKIIKNEEGLGDLLSLNNMTFDAKIAFLREWNINEIEVNNCPTESLRYFHDNNILVAQYERYNLLSVSRICFHMKMNQRSTSFCNEHMNCSSTLKSVEMTNYYSNNLKLLKQCCGSEYFGHNAVVLDGNALLIENTGYNPEIDFIIS